MKADEDRTIESARRSPAAPARLAAMGLACALFLAGAVPLILTGYDRGPTADDQKTYHLPTIHRFAGQWPRPNLSNFDSATTPGYHLFFASVLHFFHASDLCLRFLNALLTCGLIATLLWHVTRRVGALGGLVLCLPFVCSNYVFTAGVWLVPHDLGWWAVLGCLLLALRPKVDRWTLLGGALLLLATVLVRQIHVWAAAPLSVAMLLGSDPSIYPGGSEAVASPRAAPRMIAASHQRLKAWLAVAAMNLPALVVLAMFVRVWHGLAPPAQIDMVRGPNPAVPTFILALFGFFGLFFLGYFRAAHRGSRARGAVAGASAIASPRAAGDGPNLSPESAGMAPISTATAPASNGVVWRGDLRRALLGAAIGAILGAAPKSTYNYAAGRRSGLWNLVPHLPTFYNRSPLIVALAIAGGTILFLALASLRRRSRWILLTAIVAFTLAQTTNANAWQRYYEPFLLMLFPLMVVERPGGATGASRLAMAGPILLALLGAIVTAVALRTG